MILDSCSTIYSSRLLYNAYDIASSLIVGLNEIGIRMGSCKYGYLSEFCPGGNSAACNRAIIQINILDDTNARSSVTSGSNWVQSQSPVLLDHFYNGEVCLKCCSACGHSPAALGMCPILSFRPLMRVLDLEQHRGSLKEQCQ